MITEELNQLMNVCNTIKNPLIRYANLHTIEDVVEVASQEASKEGVAFAQTLGRPEIARGEHFIYEGLEFSLQYNKKYNYAANDDADHTWASCVKELATLDLQRNALMKYKKGLEAKIRANHPNMKPTSESTIVLKYHAKR